jgi:DNA (cytosine-5)-methyltransferase 1
VSLAGDFSNMPTSRKNKTGRSSRGISAVDLFCGAGGLTRGLIDAGINVVAGLDTDADCEFPFEHNNQPAKFLKLNVARLGPGRLRRLYPKGDFRVLVGCAPCQPFSRYTAGKRADGDSKWGLLRSFARLVEGTKPHVVSMENVPNLRNHKVFSEFVARLKKVKYHVSYSVVYSPGYGVPQNRSRLVLFASRLGPIEMVKPTRSSNNYPTVKDAIGKLPRLRAGRMNKADPLHCCNDLSVLNLKRIRASRPGGTWRDWPSDIIAKCHQEATGDTYASVYGRMRWDEPSPTITTQFYGFGNGRFGHPSQSRAISLREGAILQSFRANYEFVEPGSEYSAKTLGKLIGNAVPVKLGRAVGATIKRHLVSHTDAK